MNILTVLENEAAIPKMTEMISALQPDAEIMCFGSSLPALAAARRHEVDIAVLDVALQDLSGLEFGQYLQDLYPFVIIFQSFKELLFFFYCMPVLLRISQEIIRLFVSTYKSPKQSFGVCRAGAPQKAALTVFQY